MKQEECTPEYNKCLRCDKSAYDDICGVPPSEISCEDGKRIWFKVPEGEILEITRWKKNDAEN